MFIDNHGKGKSRKSRRDKKKRLKLYAQQLGLCYWCKQSMDLNPTKLNMHGDVKENRRYASFEHMIPKSMGGGHHYNRVLAHIHCNNKRHILKWDHDPIYGRKLAES
jgi:hypothetical protein